MSNQTEGTQDGATPASAAERYCLACEKLGHLTTECWSTHGVNTPAARELFRLVRATSPVDPAPASAVPAGWRYRHPELQTQWRLTAVPLNREAIDFDGWEQEPLYATPSAPVDPAPASAVPPFACEPACGICEKSGKCAIQEFGKHACAVSPGVAQDAARLRWLIARPAEERAFFATYADTQIRPAIDAAMSSPVEPNKKEPK